MPHHTMRLIFNFIKDFLERRAFFESFKERFFLRTLQSFFDSSEKFAVMTAPIRLVVIKPLTQP